MIRVRVFGSAALKRAIARLPEAVAKRTLQVAARRAAEPIREAMAENAPRDRGELADHMVVVGVRDGATEVTVSVGPDRDHFYGIFTEFGTIDQPARPWARPAWDASKEAALSRLREALWAAVRRAARRLARRA